MKKRFLTPLMISCFMMLVPLPGSSEERRAASTQYTLREGLSYAAANPELKLDLFLPRGAQKPIPRVVVIQGGGFKAQDGKRFRPFAEYLAEHGFAAALIAYRGRPHHRYRETVGDVKAAVRYLRATSGEHQIDPARIGAVGRSAGGTLAALLAVTSDVRELDGLDGIPAGASRIQSAVAFAGVFDFVARFTDARQVGLQPKLDEKKKTNGEWIGEAFSSTSQAWQLASAINHLDKEDPPMLLLHCKDDATVPWLQSEDMALQLGKAGVPVEVAYYERGGHGFKVGDGNAPMARMVAFFQKTLVEQAPIGDASGNHLQK